MNIIDLFTRSCTSKLILPSCIDLHKFLMNSKDEIFYCERKFIKGKIKKELLIKILKRKNNIAFRDFYILLLDMNIPNKSLDRAITDYLIASTTRTQWNRKSY